MWAISIDGDQDWEDPIVGLRYNYAFSDKWSLVPSLWVVFMALKTYTPRGANATPRPSIRPGRGTASECSTVREDLNFFSLDLDRKVGLFFLLILFFSFYLFFTSLALHSFFLDAFFFSSFFLSFFLAIIVSSKKSFRLPPNSVA